MNIYFTHVRGGELCKEPSKREEDSDYDLFASIPTLVQPGQIVGVPTNVKIEFPAGYEGKIEDKSGLALNKGIHILGGVIDCGYTGEILIIVVNLGKQNVLFEAGNKVAQLKIRTVTPNFKFKFVDRSLKDSERKAGGFGSTGV